LLYFAIELLLSALPALPLPVLCAALVIQEVFQGEIELLIELFDLQHEILEGLLV
jgi:hypothetical protein